MASLAEYRAQYPQYGDMSDVELADRLHDKFYKDIPKADFDAKIGVQREPGFGFDASKAFDPANLQPQEDPNWAAEMAHGMNTDAEAGHQGTSPVVRKRDGSFIREPVGEVSYMDGRPIYHDKRGNMVTISPEHQVVLRDPVSGKHLVFMRNDETDDNAVFSLYRLMAPGIATNAPTRAIGPAKTTIEQVKKPASEVVEAFDRSGIDVSLPVVTKNKGVGGTAQALGDSVAGGPVVRGTQKQIDQAAKRADDIASGLSDVGDRATAGERVQGAAQNFVGKDVPAVQSQLYDEATALIPSEMQSSLKNARAAIANADLRIKSGAVKGLTTDSNYTKLADTIRTAASKEGGLSFSDLRELRTQVRRLKPSQDSKVGLNKAAIDQIYKGLTDDMLAMAEAAGPEALEKIKKADAFTVGAARHEEAIKSVLNAKSGESAFDQVVRMASEGAGSDWSKLVEVRRAAGDSWNDIAGTVVLRLGKPTAGAAGAAEDGFSVSSFVTGWNKLSRPGREMLFGPKGTATRDALDDLVLAVGELKRVEKLANPSGTGRNLTAGFLGAGFFFEPVSTAGGLVAANVASRALMSPKIARWMAGAARLKAAGIKQPANRGVREMWHHHMSRLPAVAGRDEELARYLRQVAGAEQEEPEQQQ